MSCPCASEARATGGSISRALRDLQIENFRCIAAAELEFAPQLNVFTGGNGAGKTSLLEAIHFLGRARSFRTSDNRNLIKSQAGSALLAGRAVPPAGPTQLGIGIAPGGLDIHVGGRPGCSPADLVTALPVQAIHADIGELVQGVPEARRRLLDWGVFHVEHGFLAEWRQFRRALAQRNAVLRENGPDSLLDAWDQRLAEAGEVVHQRRQMYLEQLTPRFLAAGADILEAQVGLGYGRGWAEDQDLATALRDGRNGDRNLGYTRAGPQRADLQLQINDERSRWRASKGQQKLLASGLVLAQCGLVAERAGQPVALMVDEPAADLDASRLAALFRAILRSPAQIFLASITAEGLPLEGPAAMFHVEHGEAKPLL